MEEQEGAEGEFEEIAREQSGGSFKCSRRKSE